MKIKYRLEEISHRIKNEFNEVCNVLTKKSTYFTKFSDFIQQNTNFLESCIRLEEVISPTFLPEMSEDEINSYHGRVGKDGYVCPDNDYLILDIYGGKGGTGVWIDYLDDIQTLFVNMRRAGYHVWLISLQNDCIDDVFELKIGIE